MTGIGSTLPAMWWCESAAEGHDEVRSYVSYTLGANVEDLRLQTGAINGTGNALDNLIYGNGANNQLQGLDGNDWLFGGDRRRHHDRRHWRRSLLGRQRRRRRDGALRRGLRQRPYRDQLHARRPTSSHCGSWRPAARSMVPAMASTTGSSATTPATRSRAAAATTSCTATAAAIPRAATPGTTC